MQKQVFIDNVSARFYLRDAKKERTTIDMLYFYNGKLYKLCTSMRVDTSAWSKQKQHAIISNQYDALTNRNNEILNNRIEQLKTYVEKAKDCYKQNPSSQLNIIIKDMIKREEESIYNVIELFNKLFKTEYANRSDAKETRYAITLFERFYRSNKETILNVAKKSYMLRFKDYVIKECEGQSVTTANRRMGVIITFINKLDDRGEIKGLNEVRNWQGYKIKNDTAKDNIPFLYNEEVIRLHKHTCAKQEDEKYKDMFILECVTGQRISDIKEIDKNIHQLGDRYILDIITKKENKRVRCSIVFRLALDILQKYDFTLPQINVDYANKRLKSICEECGLNRAWTTSKHKVGSQKTEVDKKALYEVITTHVGRHTFDSLLKMRGWSTTEIAKYSGHNADMVERYTCACTDVDILHYDEVRAKSIDDIVLTIDEFEEQTRNKGNVDDNELLMAIKEVSFKIGVGEDIRGDVNMEVIRGKIMSNVVAWENVDTEKIKLICRYVYLFAAWIHDTEMVLIMERQLLKLGIIEKRQCANLALVECRCSDIINNNVRDIYGIDRWLVGTFVNPVDFI